MVCAAAAVTLAVALTLREPEVAAAAAVQADRMAVASAAGPRLVPTAACPQPAIDDLEHIIEFVQGKSWAKKPDSTALSLSPNTATCQVVLRINRLSPSERMALTKGSGSRLTIHYEHDYHRSRLPLILWTVFGGAGLIWVYRRSLR
jgi:hypothetical protein